MENIRKCKNYAVMTDGHTTSLPKKINHPTPQKIFSNRTPKNSFPTLPPQPPTIYASLLKYFATLNCFYHPPSKKIIPSLPKIFFPSIPPTKIDKYFSGSWVAKYFGRVTVPYQQNTYNSEMYWSLCGVSCLSQAKLLNYNQILGCVADQNCIILNVCLWSSDMKS